MRIAEEAFDEGFGVEGGEVVGLFAGADEEDGEVEFVGDGEDYAAFGGTVHLGKQDAFAIDCLGEGARLKQAVLAGCGVDGEQDALGVDALTREDALHFLQLFHEVELGVQSACCVDDDDIDVAGAGGLQRVECDCAGSAPAGGR